MFSLEGRRARLVSLTVVLVPGRSCTLDILLIMSTGEPPVPILRSISTSTVSLLLSLGAWGGLDDLGSVSYTHLTLPTILLV